MYQWAQQCLMRAAYHIHDSSEFALWGKDSDIHLDRAKYMTLLQETAPEYVRSLKCRLLLFEEEATYLHTTRSLVMDLLGKIVFPASLDPNAPNAISYVPLPLPLPLVCMAVTIHALT